MLTHSAMTMGRTRNTPRMTRAGVTKTQPASAWPPRTLRARVGVAVISLLRCRCGSSSPRGPCVLLGEGRVQRRLHRAQQALRVAAREALELGVEVGDDVGDALDGRDALGELDALEEGGLLGELAGPRVCCGLDGGHDAEGAGELHLLLRGGEELDELDGVVLVRAVGGDTPAVGELQGPGAGRPLREGDDTVVDVREVVG